MKVLIVASYNAGHFSPFVVEQAEALHENGCEIDFFGIVGKGLIGYFKNLPRLKRKIKEYKPDIIHAHYGLSGLLATLQNKIPVIITFHNGETLSFIPNLLSSIGAIRAKFVIYVGQHIRDLSYYKAKNYSVIPCGICLEDLKIIPKEQARRDLGFDSHKKYILFGGAFNNLRKNYPLLKKAIECIPNKDEIKCIEMCGLNRQQITQLMCAVDCFALPTKSEGSPQALKEAMGCNCPIVATNVADIAHLLGHLPGHYVTSFDPVEVAHKLKEALTFKGRTDGRNRIMELGLTNDLVAKKILDIYKKVTGGK